MDDLKALPGRRSATPAELLGADPDVRPGQDLERDQPNNPDRHVMMVLQDSSFCYCTCTTNPYCYNKNCIPNMVEVMHQCTIMQQGYQSFVTMPAFAGQDRRTASAPARMSPVPSATTRSSRNIVRKAARPPIGGPATPWCCLPAGASSAPVSARLRRPRCSRWP